MSLTALTAVGWSAQQHNRPWKAARILGDVAASHALGIHWGTFQLTGEARDAPKLALATAPSAAGVPARRCVAAQPGSVHEFDGPVRG